MSIRDRAKMFEQVGSSPAAATPPKVTPRRMVQSMFISKEDGTSPSPSASPSPTSSSNSSSNSSSISPSSSKPQPLVMPKPFGVKPIIPLPNGSKPAISAKSSEEKSGSETGSSNANTSDNVSNSNSTPSPTPFTPSLANASPSKLNNLETPISASPPTSASDAPPKVAPRRMVQSMFVSKESAPNFSSTTSSPPKPVGKLNLGGFNPPIMPFQPRPPKPAEEEKKETSEETAGLRYLEKDRPKQKNKRVSVHGSVSIRGQESLVVWANEVLKGQEIIVFDMYESWKDGVALCHLLATLFPGSIDINLISRESPLQNFTLCYHVLNQKEVDMGDISELFDGEDLIKSKNTSILSRLRTIFNPGRPMSMTMDDNTFNQQSRPSSVSLIKDVEMRPATPPEAKKDVDMTSSVKDVESQMSTDSVNNNEEKEMKEVEKVSNSKDVEMSVTLES